MSRTKQQVISDYIAARIVRNRSRKHFGSLYADALQETHMSDDLSNNAAPLRANSSGPAAEGSTLPSDATSMSVSSGIPVSVKQTDYKNLKTGEDFRGQAAQPNPLAGNDKPVRAETNDQPEGVGA